MIVYISRPQKYFETDPNNRIEEPKKLKMESNGAESSKKNRTILQNQKLIGRSKTVSEPDPHPKNSPEETKSWKKAKNVAEFEIKR